MKLVTKTTQFAEVVVTQHLQGRKPDPRCTRARGASVRPSTNTEPAGASGAPAAARCARRGRQRAPLLLDTPLPKTCAMGDIGSHWVTTWLPMSAIAWFPRTPNHPWHWMNACTHTGPAAARPAARAAAPRTERAATAARAPLGRPCAAAAPFCAWSWAQRGVLVVSGAAGWVRTASPAAIPAFSSAAGRGTTVALSAGKSLGKQVCFIFCHLLHSRRRRERERGARGRREGRQGPWGQD